MKILKIIGIVLVCLIAIVLVLGLIAPQDFKVERSVVIPASSKEVVYKNISQWEEFMKWNPWAPMDPNMKVEYKGEAGTVGSSYSWKGNDKVGEGEMTVSALKEFESVESDLHFIEPFETNNKTLFTMTPEGDGYKVNWAMSGHMSFPMNVFGLFMDMDKMVGADFERGLSTLKTKCIEEAKASQTVSLEASVPDSLATK